MLIKITSAEKRMKDVEVEIIDIKNSNTLLNKNI